MSVFWEYAGLRVEQGQKLQCMMQWPDVPDEIPICLVHGTSSGPTTLILGGIHGCEYTSIDAAIRLSQQLHPEDVHGCVAIVPVVNIPAYSARSIYVHPGDKKNLNRVFPGDPRGSVAEQLAFQVCEHLIRNCDYLIDLHGGDMNEALVPFVIYHVTDNPQLNERARQFADAFGIRYVVAGETSGSTYEAAAMMGKVAVLAEAGQQGILDPAGSDLLVAGSLNAMSLAGTLRRETVTHKDLVHLREFSWTRSQWFGAWYPCVSVNDVVQAGDKLGEIRNFFGDAIEEITSPISGTALFVVTSLAINPGDPLFAIGA